MASGQRLLVAALLLFLLVDSSSAVPVTRSLKTIKDKVAAENAELLNLEEFVEGRMNLEVEDYSGAGANYKNEPGTPGRN
ncbi:Unknown protein [Striga hermonthica]|uniref:Uncharacterized protein n=1 Tax=Striga hermonthica TaxID=68872 RepID=A0A9N7NQ10_STRHE|nr:Unknown protein [Striga hermonthica]